MSETRTTGCPGPDLLLLFVHGLLEGDEQGGVASHCDGCMSCKTQQATLGEALEAPPVVDPPGEIFEALREQIAEDQARERAFPSDAQVRLLCTYCKDDLPAPDTIYCASCVAAYHEDCFYEHGQCAAPGCEGRRIVRSAEQPIRVQETQAQGKRGGRGALLIALGVVLGGGAVAALVPGGGDTAPPVLAPEPKAEPKPEPKAEPKPEPEPGPRPEVLDLQDLVNPPNEARDDAWKEEYKRILASRTVTLNFPETPFPEVVEFLQDITGLNIVVSPKVDPEALEVSLRVRDIRLEDALAVILEQLKLSCVLENEALVIVPERVLSAEERLAQIAAQGVKSPEWAFEIRRRLESQQITLSFDETPLEEALDFMRDITGLNIVVKEPAAIREATVSVRLRNISLRNAMDLLLKGHDLGVRLANGVLWIVPRTEATEGQDKARKKQALLDRDCGGLILRNGSIADLASRLKTALGSGGHVVLSDAAQASKARVILPEGKLTVGDALDLVEAEADVSHVLAWLAEGDAVLVLDVKGPGLLAQAKSTLGIEVSENSHAIIKTELRKQRTRLTYALRDLDGEAMGLPTLASLKGAVDVVRVQHEALEQLVFASRALNAALDAEFRARARAQADRVIATYQTKSAELRAVSLVRDATTRSAQRALVAKDKELRALGATYNKELASQQEKGLEARDALRAANAEGAGPDAKQRLEEARRAVVESDDASLAMARSFDQKQKDLRDEKQAMLDAMTRNSRDHALQIARLDSERTRLKERMRDVVPDVFVLAELRRVDAVLKRGGSHAAIDDYGTWRKQARAKAEEAFGKALVAYDKLGAQFSAQEDKSGLVIGQCYEGTRAAKAGLKPGDVVDSTPSLGDLVDLFEHLAGHWASATFVVERDGKREALVLPLD